MMLEQGVRICLDVVLIAMGEGCRFIDLNLRPSTRLPKTLSVYLVDIDSSVNVGICKPIHIVSMLIAGLAYSMTASRLTTSRTHPNTVALVGMPTMYVSIVLGNYASTYDLIVRKVGILDQ